MMGHAEVDGRGAGPVCRGGGDEEEGVGGTLIAKVVDLSRKMYFTKRTVERASVMICDMAQRNNVHVHSGGEWYNKYMYIHQV